MELPLHLFWFGRDSRDSQFSLDDPSRRRELYRTVLRETRSPDDLAAFLDGGMLTALWARLALPKVVRKAWEDQHPALRPPAAPSGLHSQLPGARDCGPVRIWSGGRFFMRLAVRVASAVAPARAVRYLARGPGGSPGCFRSLCIRSCPGSA